MTRGMAAFNLMNSVVAFLDSPATTSPVTYKAEVRQSSAGTIFVNRAVDDTASGLQFRSVSTITAIEVAP